MRTYGTTIVLLVWVMLGAVAGTSFAQEQERVGLAMGYPASVGVVWRVSDGFALKPEISLSRNSVDSTTPAPFAGAQSSTDTHVTVALSALIDVQHRDALRAYVSPRFEYSRAASQATSTLGTTSLSELTASNYSVGGAFGAHYLAARHFGIFGELGLIYSHSTTSAVLTDVHGNGVSTRSSVGVIFYF